MGYPGSNYELRKEIRKGIIRQQREERMENLKKENAELKEKLKKNGLY